MEHVGRSFEFDYGEFAVRVEYLSGSRLRWEQVKGPNVGLTAEQPYTFVGIRPALYFLSWQESDSSVVTQVADFEKQLVHTVWISPEKRVEHFSGTIRTADR